MILLENMLTGTYSDCCREAFQSLQPKNAGILPIEIIEMQSDEVWWLQIKYNLADFAGLSESNQYKWAGFIKKVRDEFTNNCNKLVEIVRVGEE